MKYQIKLSSPEGALLEEVIRRDGRPVEIRYTKDISRAKIYNTIEDARRDAEIIPYILKEGTSGQVDVIA